MSSKDKSLERLIKLYPKEVLSVLKNDSRIIRRQNDEIDALKSEVKLLKERLGEV